MKGTLIGGLVALVVGFLVGWYPESAKRATAEADAAATHKKLESTEQSLAIYTFRNRAALLHEVVESNDYATGGQEATRLFTDMREFANKQQAGPVRDGVEKLLGRRDAIIAGLAKADPAVKADLRDLFMGMQKI